MKICLVIPTLKQGGAERVISELANEFVKQGNLVFLIVLAKSNDFYSIDSNVKVFRLDFENKGIIAKIFSEISVFFKVRNLLKKIHPDAILSFMDKYNILVLAASRFLKLKVFVSDRSNPKKKIPLIILFFKKIFYRFATGIIAQTSLAKNILKEITGHANIKVISNPIKIVDLYSEVKREKIILNIGRLVPEKGHKYLIEAFNLLDSNDWKLVIIGEGILRKDIEKQIDNLNLKDKVLLLGTIVDVDIWYAKASIFAFPSISEGFPNALVEAMSAGLPCVSFDCDAGPSDIIQNGINGYLVRTKEVDGLAKILDELINDEELRLNIGLNAMKVKETFDSEKISKEFLTFFKSSV